MSRLLFGVLSLLVALLLVGAPLAAEEVGLPAEEVARRANEDPQEVKNRFSPQLKTVQIDIQTVKVELARMLASPQPDRAQVKGLIARMLDLQKRKQMLLVDQMFDTLECMPQGSRDEFLQPIIDQLLR
jgi:hypothetical protein